MDLTSYKTITSASNPDDKILLLGKAGDIKSGGKGKLILVGVTGKYAGMTGECEYTVKYLPKNKINGILDCSYKKYNKRISEPCFTSSIYNLYF